MELPCPKCDSNMLDHFQDYKLNDYKLIEFGLNNITLVNWKGFRCIYCGHFSPNYISLYPDKFIKVLVKIILTKPSLLNGHEILFLRKHAAGKRGQEFADMIGMRRVRLSRLENGREQVTDSEDKKIRALAASRLSGLMQIDQAEIVRAVYDKIVRVFVPGFHINLTKKEGLNELEYSTYYFD